MAWLVPLVPLLAAPLVGLLGRTPAGAAPGRGRLAAGSALVMLATATLAVLAGLSGWTARSEWTGALGLHLDFAHSMAAMVPVFAVLVPVIALPVLVYAAYHEEGRGLGRLLAILTFFVGAMELVAGAADLLTLLIGWELIGACSAMLVAHEWRDAEKPRAGAVVFLTTRTGDLGLFLAAVAAFAGAGSLEYATLAGLEGLHLHLLALGLLTAAAAKSAQLPFSPWLFAAMEGPVTVSTLLHSATMVAAGAFVLIRLHPVLEPVAWFGAAAVAVGLATAVAGGVVALLQPHAKRLLAGSTSAHYGLMFVAVGAGYPAVAGVHLVAHAFSKAPLFLASGIAEHCVGSYKLHRMGLRSLLPGAAVATALAAAAIGGLPPLGAAWSKEKVVAAAGHQGAWLAVLVSVAGALSAAYMARFFFQMFGAQRQRCETRPAAGEQWPLFSLAAGALLLGVLWLPGVHAIGPVLPGEPPSGRSWELVVSLALVAGGLAVGYGVARRSPALGEVGLPAGAAGWLGLPALAYHGITRPVRAVARGLAGFDDRIMDGVVRAAAAAARRISSGAALFDDRIVDGVVRLVAALGAGLAAAGRRLLESLVDGVPEGTSRLVGWAGARTRRLQTGLSHHYYRLMVAGLAIVLVLLILGG